MLAEEIAERHNAESEDKISFVDVLKKSDAYLHPRRAGNRTAEYGVGVQNAPEYDSYGFVSPALQIREDGLIWDSGTGLNQGRYGLRGTQTEIFGAPVKDPEKIIEKLEGSEFYYEYFEPTDKLGAGRPNPKSHIAYAYAANVAVLDGEGRVTDIYAAYDAGKVVNPLSIQGQIEGGVLMSMGYALTEDFPLKDCVPQAKFGTLGLLRAPQIPSIHAMYSFSLSVWMHMT